MAVLAMSAGGALFTLSSGCSSKVYSADCNGMVEHAIDCGGTPPGDTCHFQALMVRFGCGEAFFGLAACLAEAACGANDCPDISSSTLKECIAATCADGKSTDPVCSCNEDPNDLACICAKDPNDPEC